MACSFIVVDVWFARLSSLPYGLLVCRRCRMVCSFVVVDVWLVRLSSLLYGLLVYRRCRMGGPEVPKTTRLQQLTLYLLSFVRQIKVGCM